MSLAYSLADRESPHSADLEMHITDVHPDWRAAWGASLPERLREEIFENPRLRRRLGAQCAVACGAASLARQYFSESEKLAYRAYMDAPTRVAWLCGLIWHAESLAAVIGGEEFRNLARVVPNDDVAFAVKYRSLSRSAPSTKIDPARFARAVRTSGQRCVVRWAMHLPESLRYRVKLTLPRVIGVDAPTELEFDPHAGLIVDTVLQKA
jgi:hypothetical protein